MLKSLDTPALIPFITVDLIGNVDNFEIGLGQAQNVLALMKDNGFSNLQIIKDYQNIDRVIYGLKL